MIFVFTGKFNYEEAHIARELLEEAARERGHYVVGYIDYSVDYLVVGKVPRKTKKLKDAHACGVKIISPQQFMEMIEDEAQ